jgi:exopolysaccharide production protein ExoQ
MHNEIATIVYVIGMVGLFYLDRDKNAPVSRAIWIPVAWLLINCSRPISMWLQTGPTVDSADQYLDGSPLDAVLFALLLLAGVAALTRRPKEVFRLLQSNAALLIFILYCLVSVVWSDYPFVAFKRWTKGIGDVVMVLIVLTDTDQLAAFKALIKRTAFILIPVSVILIKYHPELGRAYSQWTWEPFFTGVTTNKNTLGMVCLVMGLGCFWQFFTVFRDREDPHRVRRIFVYATLLLMTLWLFHIANSMTSLACFVLGACIIMATNLRLFVKTPIVIHVLVLMLVSVVAFALFFDPQGTLVRGIGRDPTLTGRTPIWSLVISLTTNPLLGCGYESFWLGERLQKVWDFEQGIQEAHNGYLEVYLNLGLIGVFLIALLIITGYRNAISYFRREPGLGGLKLAYFTTGVVYSLTEAGFRMLAPIWIFFLLSITAVPKPKDSEQDDSSPLLSERITMSRSDAQVGELVGARRRREAI